jgi:hypothetical protein
MRDYLSHGEFRTIRRQLELAQSMTDLRLQALDVDDLAIFSAHCQDAVVRIADIAYQRADKRFALMCNRFDWTTAHAATKPGGYNRCQSGVRFEAVTRVQLVGFDPKAVDGVLVLLAISFSPTEEPAGRITLQFAAGAAIRLDVEYIEAELKDLGAVWSTPHKPDHVADETLSASPGVPTGSSSS